MCHALFIPTAVLPFYAVCLGCFGLNQMALKTSDPGIINIYHLHILPSIILQNRMRFCHWLKKGRLFIYEKQGRHSGTFFVVHAARAWPLTHVMMMMMMYWDMYSRDTMCAFSTHPLWWDTLAGRHVSGSDLRRPKQLINCRFKVDGLFN